METRRHIVNPTACIPGIHSDMSTTTVLALSANLQVLFLKLVKPLQRHKIGVSQMIPSGHQLDWAHVYRIYPCDRRQC